MIVTFFELIYYMKTKLIDYQMLNNNEILGSNNKNLFGFTINQSNKVNKINY
jgi:hypothetical protein